MSAMREREMGEKRRPPRAEATVRLETFMDGVIAIVVTLLVLELHVPSAEGDALGGALVALMPKLASLAVSFATVAIYWVNHHHFFERVRYTDGASALAEQPLPVLAVADPLYDGAGGRPHW